MKYAKSIWLFLGLTLLVFIVMEFGSWAILSLGNPISTSSKRAQAFFPGYKDPLTAHALFEEWSKASDYTWHPFYYWRKKPFQGTHINVDNQGVRQSFNPPLQTEHPYEVFFFGGSSTWGYGVTDQETVPSFFSKIAHQNSEFPVQVTNYGEEGFVSTQDVILLMELLKQGHRPDMVIFLDGFNDVQSVLHEGNVGNSSYEQNRRREFNLLNTSRRDDLYRHAITTWVHSFHVTRLWKKVLFRVGLIENAQPSIVDLYHYPVENPEEKAKKIVQIYNDNLQMVRALANSYHFQPLFYWQPDVTQKERPTSWEKMFLKPMQLLHPLYGLVHEELRAQKQPEDFYDVSQIFADDEKAVFIDFVHIAPSGNERIAQHMFENAKPFFSKIK